MTQLLVEGAHVCLHLRGDWLLSDRLEELRLQPGVQHAQAGRGTRRAWIGFLWLCIVKEWEQIWCPRSLGYQGGESCVVGQQKK